MRRVAKILALAGVVFALSIAAAYLLIESGEVLVLRASPEDGNEFLARLWVVEHDERVWISTTDPSKTDWVPWLRSHETVEIERDGLTSCRQAKFDDQPEVRGQLNKLLNARYRVPSYGSRYLKMLGGAKDEDHLRVWIRLDPCSGF